MTEQANPLAHASDDDRALIVAGLQALYRERKTAWNSASTVAILRGEQQPSLLQFGLSEVQELLTRVGAAPSSF